MAITLNGSGSITGLSSGAGISASALSGQVPDANAPSGSVIQVVSASVTSPFSASNGGTYNYVDFTGLSVTITPTSSTSTFLLTANISAGSTNLGNTVLRFARNGTAVGIGTGSGYNVYGFNSWYEVGSSGTYSNSVMSGQFLDSPATASAITYKIQFTGDYSGTMYFNRRESDTRFSTISTLTVMEISA